MIRTSLPGVLAIVVVAATPPAAAQQTRYEGTYEYAAPGWRGLLEVSTAADDTTYFAINTRNNGLNCRLFGTGRLSDNTITLRDQAGGSVILRFFEDNAEVETAGSTAAFCDAGAQIGGIYIQTSETVTFDREDIRTAQSQLNKLGFDAGPVDGVMGQRTRSALAAFQRRSNLPPTGELSLQTLHRLEEQVSRATTSAADAAPGTGQITADERPAETGPTAIDWMAQVPRTWIPVLDRLYRDAVPARIDWSNPPFELAIRDLDQASGTGQNQEEALVFWNDVSFCGDEGCTFEVLAFENGAYRPVLQTVARDVRLGETYDNGRRRLIVDGEPWVWDGDSYTQEVYVPTPVR